MGDKTGDGNFTRSLSQICRHTLVLFRCLASNSALHVFTADTHLNATSTCCFIGKSTCSLFDFFDTLCSSSIYIYIYYF